jgi:Domain of unknown function DUF29
MAETKVAGTDPAVAELYDKDLCLWAETMAARLRAHDTEALDWENIAEEIQSLSRSDRRELENRLIVVIAHLLKWQYQPALRERASWRFTLDEQRRRIARLLRESPSLRPNMPETWAEVYRDATTRAMREMKSEMRFPESCPYTEEQVLDPDFLPN